MADNAERKDESSIRPVSSLRSRFENLEKDKGTSPASPIVGRSPFLSGDSTAVMRRPSTPSSQPVATNPTAGDKNDNDGPTFQRRRQSPSKSRPQSMMSVTPSQKPPPLVTVDSPHTPEKTKNMSVDLRIFRANTPDLGRPGPGADSPTKPHSRTLSRAATPVAESRVSMLLPTAEAPRAQSEGARSGPPTPEIKPKTQATSVPPPVNRAGKPKVPTKPAALANKPEGLSAPEPSADLTDQSVSPFSTPPSSGTSSPNRKQSGNENRPRNESDASFVSRARTDSDPSFVERVRTDSNASSGPRSRFESNASFVERARAGSNASFVEPSSLPETWHHFQPPPIHQHVTARREPQLNGMSRPARYRPVAASDRTAAGDLSEDRPRLPVRPELQIRSGRVSPPKVQSGRTSPLKNQHSLLIRRSTEGLKRASTMDAVQTLQRIPANKPVQRSALNQGFDRTPQAPAPVASQIAPTVPAPRRSMDRRREMPAAAPVTYQSHDDSEDAAPFDGASGQPVGPSDYPDSSQASRRPPKYRHRPWQIPTDYDTRTFAACGEYVCTTGNRTKAWSLRTGEQLLDMEHNDMTKVSSLVFKPSASVEEEGKRLWLGTSIGEIHEVDIPAQAIVKTRSNAHTWKDIIRIYRYASDIWTLDESGELNVWKPDGKGSVSLDSQYINYRVPRGHTFSIALGKHLWIGAGKEIRVFAPSARSDTEFQVLRSPLSQPGTGEIHSGTILSGKPDLAYFGHQDGKVSIYNRHDFSCSAVVNVSMYKLSCLAGVGDYLWAGFNTGMAYVYDTSTTPWLVKKDWQAHERQICGINADRSAVWKMDRLQVVTLGTDNMLRI